jgi:putative transposase
VGPAFLPAGGTVDIEDNDVPGLKMRWRRLPHWELVGSTYFITFCLLEGELSAEEIQLVLGHIKDGDPDYYDLYAATVLPDHVHIILRPRDGMSLSRVTKGVKGVSAKLINERRGRRGALWQAESYDRIIRDDKEMEEKIAYIFTNAIRLGLSIEGWDYPGLYLRG